jgi:MFS family permease
MSDTQPPNAAPEQSGAAVDPYAPWRTRNFRLYAASWFVLMFGKQIETLAVQVYIYHRTGDPLYLGLIGLAQAMPVVLLAIPGGQLADRFDRRRVMILTLAVSVVVSAALAVLARGDAPLPWIYALLTLSATSQALGSPSRSALLPTVVPTAIFTTAVTWNSTVFQIASMTGPAIGGLLMDRTNASVAFAAVAVCKLLSLLTIAFVVVQASGRRVETVSWESLVAGIHFVRRTRLILATITLDLFAVLLGGAAYLLPVFAKDILHVGNLGLGTLRSAEAVGAVAMAVLLAHLPPMRRAGRAMLWAVAGFGAATIVFGLSQWFWLSLAMMFAIGALDNISVVVRHTLVQMLTPDAMRGRVSAVNNIFIVASNDLGGLESGLTARLFGPVISVVGGGLGTILVVPTSAKIWPEILRLGSLAEVRPEETIEEREI